MPRKRIESGALFENPPVALFAFGSCANVRLTAEELAKLKERFGPDAADGWIETLSLQKLAHGYKYLSDYAAILAWARKRDPAVRSVPRLAKQPKACAGHRCDYCVPAHDYGCTQGAACGMSHLVICPQALRALGQEDEE